MIKDTAVQILCEHFSEGMVRTIVNAIAEDEREECAKMFEELQIVDEAKNNLGGCIFCGFTPKLARQAIRARGQE